MADWLKLHRKSLDSRVFSDPQMWRLWCWCLMRTNWKRGWFEGCEVQPGQFAIGRMAASEELGVSGSAWYRGMQKLQEFGCIRLQVNNRFTLVSIVNWRKYQGELNSQRTTDEQLADNERTTGEQQADTIEEGLDFKEGKKLSFSKNPSKHFVDDEFRKVWAIWLLKQEANQFRPMDSATEQSQLYELERFETQEAIEIVRFSSSRTRCHNLITNGDHRAGGQAQAVSGNNFGPRRRTPPASAGIFKASAP